MRRDEKNGERAGLLRDRDFGEGEGGYTHLQALRCKLCQVPHAAKSFGTPRLGIPLLSDQQSTGQVGGCE